MHIEENPRMNSSVAEGGRDFRDPISEFTLPLKVIGQAIAYPFFLLFQRIKRRSK